MADPRFYSAKGPFTVRALAEIAGAALSSDSDPDRVIRDVAPLATAGPECLGFLDNPRYATQFAVTRAGACLVRPESSAGAPRGMCLLFTGTPYKAYAKVAQAFYPREAPVPGVAPSATVDPGAKIGEGTAIGAGAVVGPGAEIGRRCRIGANAVIGPGVTLGDDCVIGASTSLHYCLVGRRVRMLAGVRIGEDGFGFAPDPDVPVDIPQLGRVIIEDDVEIGANTTIDRGAGPDTVIGAGTRIDNLVQIGHNVTLGRGCIVIAQAGISGSTKLEDYAIVAAQGGVAGHLTVGKGARVAAKSGVMRDVPPGVSVGGIPAVGIRQWFRQVAILQRLARSRDQ
jgi:UDP-3-O-[3-hydroxymyristoyl] glucosamine N-acyltransferase